MKWGAKGGYLRSETPGTKSRYNVSCLKKLVKEKKPNTLDFVEEDNSGEEYGSIEEGGDKEEGFEDSGEYYAIPLDSHEVGSVQFGDCDEFCENKEIEFFESEACSMVVDDIEVDSRTDAVITEEDYSWRSNGTQIEIINKGKLKLNKRIRKIPKRFGDE